MLTTIFTISGFTESRLKESDSEVYHRELIEPYDEQRLNIDVMPVQPWNLDYKGLAALAKRSGTRQAIIFGYSWGGGYGAPMLARALQQQGICIRAMILCDAVYRPLWLPAHAGLSLLVSFRALFNRFLEPIITLPRGIQTLCAIRQSNTKPSGHRLRITRRGSPIDPQIINNTHTTHSNIDRSPEWLALVRGQLNTILGPIRR